MCEKVLAMLKGEYNKLLCSFNVGHFSFSHAVGGGGKKFHSFTVVGQGKIYPVSVGRGGGWCTKGF